MMILLTGGSKCGKSTLAERLAVQLSAGNASVTYVATMLAKSPEDFAIIARHQAMRQGKPFFVVERSRGLHKAEWPQGGVALLEDVPNLLANEIFGGDGAEAALTGIWKLLNAARHLVVVTNEVGGDGICYQAETLAYIDELGRLNQLLAKRADAVAEVVCGQPHVLKGALPCL